MATNFLVSGASRALALNAALDVLNTGFLDVYSGTQPVGPDTALGAQVLLVSCALNATAFAAAVAGTNTATKTANAVSNGTAGATGTAAWFRMYKSNHTTAVCDGTVGTSGCDATITSTAIVTSEVISVTSVVITG